MNTEIHFIDVGQGNMVLIRTTNAQNYLCDCNVTSQNEGRVLAYLSSVLGNNTPIHAFICTHRDADHMRGIKKVHARFPIGKIWDSGYPGTTTNSSEYTDYMDLRRRLGYREIIRQKREDYGQTRFRYFSAKDERLLLNANAQGIVLKIEHRFNDQCRASALLTGDCDAETWRCAIMEDYAIADVKSSILMGAHHGSLSFFDDPGDSKHYYLDHIKAIAPEMTVISVGPNTHGHPDPTAFRFYTDNSSGSKQGNKVFTTQEKGTMKLVLKDDGWSLTLVGK
ncbi:ComEC/Rec2 family competence protein [Thalassospira xiamenensis]|uniref:Metal-dependent hydrolase, beta-lactamase superfamily II n=1 Tax=Thalassospira xiamenensis TaxID=220697 RepID=A0A285TYD9_9PROT|nr:MBL fold metallo-hydrolase [Thalassospira xiamenensis]SOC31092.1 Metal-dependent hydrolase, beta-lactamase superfamily II [Thalassospira xiamenensis]